MNIIYKIQKKPNGIAEAFLIAEDFINGENICLILGDNIFHGINKPKIQKNGATIFAYKVSDPTPFGVVEFDKNGNITCRDLTLAMHAFKVITEQARTYIIGDPNAENSYTTEEKEQNFQKLCEVELDKSNVPLSTLIPKDCETLKQLFNQFFEGRNSKIQVLKIENLQR